MTESNSKPASKEKDGQILVRLKRAFGWGLLGATSWRFLTALSSILVARILGPVGFGELGIVRSIANMFALYAGFRMGTTASKHLAQYRNDDPNKAISILSMTMRLSAVFCVVSAAIMLLGAGFIAENWLQNEALTWPVRICAVFMFYQAYSAVREEILIGAEHFQSHAKVNVVKGISTAVFFTLGAYFYGVSGALVGLALAAILSYFALSHFIRKTIAELGLTASVPFQMWKQELPLLWNFALPGLLVGVLMVTTTFLVKSILVRANADGYGQLGFFEVANQWRTLVLFIPAVFSRLAMPILAESFQRSPDSDFRTAAVTQFRVIMSISLPITVCVIFFSPILMLLFGAAFDNATAVMPVLMISVFLFSLNQSLSRVQDGLGRRWQNFFLYCFWAVTLYVVAASTVETLGAVGLAYAFLAAETVLFVAISIYVEVYVNKRILLSNASGILVSIAVIAGAYAVFVLTEGAVFYVSACLLSIFSVYPLVNAYLNRNSVG